MSLFFFSCSADHRDLHSFPTRRSSDLRGRFAVLLSGGETPRLSYQLLARHPLVVSIPWQGVHLFWGDERWVPQDDPRSKGVPDRKSTRLNSSHPSISYAVFCVKKKKTK